MPGPYEKSLTVPVNRPLEDPVSVELEIEGEVVTKVEIDYPEGCAHMVKTAIFYGIAQLWPVEVDSWFTADGFVIAFEPDWDMPDQKMKLTFKGCSPETQHPHTITIRIHTGGRAAARPFETLYSYMEALADAINRLARVFGV